MRELDPEKLREIEAVSREIGRILGSAINDIGYKGRYGFALMLFSFEGPEFTYISNADRDDMIRVLEEFIAKCKSGGASLTSDRKN
jgi:hypothetical protein